MRPMLYEATMNGTQADDATEATRAQQVATKDMTAEDRVRAPSLPDPLGEPTRLPKRIAGGFRGLGEDLDRRGREWTNMVRVLEQQRLQMEAAEEERDDLYEKLARISPEVQETGRALKSVLDACKSGDVSGDLATQFAKSMRSIEDLEKVAVALSANFLWCRSAWEQYARSVIKAQRLREEVRQSGHDR